MIHDIQRTSVSASSVEEAQSATNPGSLNTLTASTSFSLIASTSSSLRRSSATSPGMCFSKLALPLRVKKHNELVRNAADPDNTVCLVLSPAAGQVPLQGLPALLAIAKTMPVARLQFWVRNRVKITHTQALFMYTRGRLLVPSATLEHVHREACNAEDGFVYIEYALENTFG